ncbi:NAD(P)H-binding protein [Panacagrimonas sp.]|uniref:NAD(P)H-binding protein n=1 Tax=Panacagrimonas sp. TaxID=2480088 RepID=UPI003B524827
MSRTALVAGHTGLVGRQLIAALVLDPRYASVKAVGRRAPDVSHPKLEFVQTELAELRRVQDRLGADDAYCCLGTTLRAAGSKTAFERVDYHMVVDFARAACEAGARRFYLVSSLSASPRSPLYYSRVKGRTEQAVIEVGFDTVHILRPSLLLGARQEHRPGEAIAQKLAPLVNLLLSGPLRRYRAVPAEEVAQALLSLSSRDTTGPHVHTLPLEAEAA